MMEKGLGATMEMDQLDTATSAQGVERQAGQMRAAAPHRIKETSHGAPAENAEPMAKPSNAMTLLNSSDEGSNEPGDGSVPSDKRSGMISL
jgi:hypothetical protein